MDPTVLQTIKDFVSSTGADVNYIKAKWQELQTIEDDSSKLIAVGVLLKSDIYNIYKKWESYDLQKYGIENFQEFWTDTVVDKIDKIKSEHDAVTIVDRELQSRLRSKSQEFDGIVIASSRKRDNFSQFINMALEMYRTDPEAAKQSGYIKDFPNIEALREKYPEVEPKLTDKYFVDGSIAIPFGKADVNIVMGEKKFVRNNWYNGRYDGKAVIGTAYMKGMTVLARPKGGEYQKFELTLSDEQCDINVPIGVHVKFFANISPSNKTRLNPTSNMQFTIIDDGSFDLSVADKPLKSMIIPFDGLLDYVKNMKESDRWNTKAVWARVMEAPPTEGNRYIVLSDDKERSLADMGNLFNEKGEINDISMHCPVPEEIVINFGEGSKILVIGQPRFGSSFVDGSWQEDKSKVSMWVSGIYVPKEEQVEMTHTVDVSEQELHDTFDSKEEKPTTDLASLDEL